MRRDVDRNQRVARFSGRAGPALTFQADLLAARNARRNLDLDVLAGRQMYARLGALGCIGKRDRQRRVQILPGAGRCAEIFRLELLAETPRRAGTAAKHPAQKILEAGAATATARTAEAIGAEAEAFELRAAARTGSAARLPAEAFKPLEARLAFGIDLAAVEGLAL